MANITFLCGSLEKVNARTVANGQLLFATDSKQLFIDNSDTRIEIAEIVHVSVLPAVASAIANKFYYVDGSNILAISDGTKWIQVNAQSTIETGETNGTIKVNGTEVAVAGLGTAAYKAVEDFDAAGEAAKVLGTEADTSDKATVYGVKALADAKVASVTATDKSITVGGTATAPTVGVTISTTEGNALKLDENGLIVTIPTAAEYTVKKETTAENGFIATYQLYKDETAVGDKINIPKDYLVKSASINTCAADGTPAGFTAGQKYIDFVINSVDGAGNESHIYLNVTDLVDVYTAGDGITISDANAVSVNVKVENGLSITDNKIALALATADTAGEGGAAVAGTAGAMSGADKTKLDGIAAGAEVNYIKAVEGALAVDGDGKLTIGAASATAAGTMSADDKKKLDGIAEGAEVNVVKSVEGALSVSEAGVLSVATADATKDGIISKETFSKIDGIETGAQANKIETISFNGTDVTITDKKAAINLAWVEL